MRSVNKYNELVIKYGNSVNFLTIYIREAHASDSEWPDTRTYSIKNHRTLTDRLEAAAGLQEFGVAGRLMVDSMDDLSLLHYGALPERLCVIGTNGVVLYLGEMGPWGYSLNDLEHCLENLIE
ncbi:unnamed protein product [Lymnaea stagnalis]|uniref:Iodothyronine deiodinase n=1 Tax=Lymnaea stagnalis TaxID=6523 RepID=A0AAV2H004_LYMST